MFVSAHVLCVSVLRRLRLFCGDYVLFMFCSYFVTFVVFVVFMFLLSFAFPFLRLF